LPGNGGRQRTLENGQCSGAAARAAPAINPRYQGTIVPIPTAPGQNRAGTAEKQPLSAPLSNPIESPRIKSTSKSAARILEPSARTLPAHHRKELKKKINKKKKIKKISKKKKKKQKKNKNKRAIGTPICRRSQTRVEERIS
jgi:hypothetical protein